MNRFLVSPVILRDGCLLVAINHGNHTRWIQAPDMSAASLGALNSSILYASRSRLHLLATGENEPDVAPKDLDPISDDLAAYLDRIRRYEPTFILAEGVAREEFEWRDNKLCLTSPPVLV